MDSVEAHNERNIFRRREKYFCFLDVVAEISACVHRHKLYSEEFLWPFWM